ncbi:MAG: sensor domain-containing diguanylate cyclase [Cellulomonas sp.]|nr:sensor domain-containing diguanylate cyclase [Cellulomonas sp.]MCR6649011.1 sensor domain-containing diguanylate cyclase [Cellulomonas sp.]
MTPRVTAGARGGRRAAAALSGARGFALAAHRLESARSLDEVVQTAAALAAEMLRARLAATCRIEHETMRVLHHEPASDPRHGWRLLTTYRAEDRPALRRLIRERESWVAHAQDVTGQPTEPGAEGAGDPVEVAQLLEVGAASSLGAPIVVNGAVWGEIFALRGPDGGLFTTDDVATAEVLAALVAGAIARVDLEEQIRHLVADDPLTGLANRRVADNAAEAALESGEEVCIVMCDVDGLKRVNDELGHDVGDDLLRSVADVMRRAVERLPGSTAARLGGDEFCLVTVGQHRAEVAEVMLSTTLDFPLPHGAAISYGLASTAITGEISARHLFRRADIAQYRVEARPRACPAVRGADRGPRGHRRARRRGRCGGDHRGAVGSGASAVRARGGDHRDARRVGVGGAHAARRHGLGGGARRQPGGRRPRAARHAGGARRVAGRDRRLAARRAGPRGHDGAARPGCGRDRGRVLTPAPR